MSEYERRTNSLGPRSGTDQERGNLLGVITAEAKVIVVANLSHTKAGRFGKLRVHLRNEDFPK